MGPKGPVCYEKVGIAGGRLASSLGRRAWRTRWRHRLHVGPAVAFVGSLAGSSRSGCLPQKRTFLSMGKSTKYLGLGKTLARAWSGNIWNYSMVKFPLAQRVA